MTANVVAPGLLGHGRLRLTYSEEEGAVWRDQHPMRRKGKPSEIAETVVFPLSDGAAYITGQTLRVNGGAHST